jgi:hypothetical protein
LSSTNYFNVFIEVAEDCPVTVAEIPPQKGEKTAAVITFEMVKNNPYRYTSDEVLFHIFALKNGIAEKDMETEKERFFSKGQPCLRSSPLGKRYGWGVHANSEGKIAIYAVESDEYENLSADKRLKNLKAMRSKKFKDS